MIDNQLLRSDLDGVQQNLARRGFHFPRARYLELEGQRKTLQVDNEQLQNQRKTLAAEIGRAKREGQATEALMRQAAEIAERQSATAAALEAVQGALNGLLLELPNLLDETVPTGKDEDENVEVRRVGTPRAFSFTPKEHADLEGIGLDFAAGVKLAGARFTVLRGALARLHRALAQFMLDTHTEKHGYLETYVPYLANADTLLGTGQLPKFADDLFKTSLGERDFYLLPTAEVALTNLVRDTIVEASDLPLKFTAQTPCFRSEAGAHGKDVRGMIRQHQFDKVEMVQIVAPEHSDAALEELTGHAEVILKQLALPYRVMMLCSGDLGFGARKTYDLEVWLPGQGKYREISSCSNCGDFQARRLSARYRLPGEKKPRLVHTLNGSGLAVGRTLVAILENYQNEDGSISIPEVLRPYLNGLSRIESAQ